MWKDSSTSVQNNKMGSLGRLQNLLQNLQRNKEIQSYDQVTQEQLAEGVEDKVNDEANCGKREFYFHTKQLFMKMLTVESCKLYMMHP